MTLYLLDTDAVIDFFKGFPSSVDLIQNLFQRGGTLCTCAVVIAEVYAGLDPSERTRGEELLGSLRFLRRRPEPPSKQVCGVTHLHDRVCNSQRPIA
jgi:predicted nucleic acid-binding protein